MKQRPQRKDIKLEVTNKIISLMAQGTAVWKMTWQVGAASGMPMNAVTGKPYNGVNVLILWAMAHEVGYTSNKWLTYKQAQEVGGQVRKGEKSVTCVYFQMVEKKKEKKNDDQEFYPMAKAFNLFNVEQIDNLPEQYQGNKEEKTAKSKFIANNFAENFIAATGADIRHLGKRAYYQPTNDYIALPKKEAFITPENYYATALHELTHWTGHKSRLDRDFTKSKRFGDEAYAFEELVAELGAAFLCANFGFIDATVENHASYLNSWIRVLSNDKNAIFTAASKASAAFDYLIHISEENKCKKAA